MTGRRRDTALLLAIAAVVGLPFLNKPFHIDDPFILGISANILQNPLDPFTGFSSWFGRPDPIWSMATNPPLISYYLAPFASWSDYSEVVLHTAMLPFLWMLAAALLSLGRRFSDRPWFAVLLVMSSAGVVVSSNVMRDVPTAALSTAAIACFVRGCDEARRGALALGALLAGLAILMKYSAVILLPLMLLYALLKARPRAGLWAALTLAMLGLWCLHNLWIYGETQIGLLMTRDWGPLASWRDNLCGLPVVAGSLLYLLPLLLWRGMARLDWLVRVVPFGLLVVWWSTQYYLQGNADLQYLFWSLTGSALLAICLAEGIRGGFRLTSDWRDERAGDSLFLFAWLCAPLLFSVVFVPFQAVRHLLPALPPLVLLGLRALERWREGASESSSSWERRGLAATVAVQAAVAFLVAAADYEHAATYRDFAAKVGERWPQGDRSTWYVGHWGWFFYAERAGLVEIDLGGPRPQPGDRLVQPVNYRNDALPKEWIEPESFVSSMVRGARGSAPRFYREGEESYAPRIPLRAMHPAGAGFYAMYSWRSEDLPPSLPYRWLPAYPLESFDVYVVAPP